MPHGRKSNLIFFKTEIISISRTDLMNGKRRQYLKKIYLAPSVERTSWTKGEANIKKNDLTPLFERASCQ